MTTACVISNYNYARFVGDAVDSALAQAVPFDEIIVIDDGSTDGSVELLASRYAQHQAVQIVCKDNAGQLSCFNEGFARTTADIVFFLDADDMYEPNYVEQALEVYDRDPALDFVFCQHRRFGQQDRLQARFSQDRDLGYSVILTACLREWIGAPTSCLSMRRNVLEKILPLPFLEAWRTRADDCLVFGASLAGARKYCLAPPLVRYRVHGDNQFFGRSQEACAVYRRRLAINVLFEHLERKFGYNVERLAEVHHREFRTIASPTFRQLLKYVRVSRGCRISHFRRLSCLADMISHFLRTALASQSRAGDAASPSLDHESTPPLRVFGPRESAANSDARPTEHRRYAA
jgi:glycosyltransferase involved in cell wall biosynthesis